jgi:hypothetical protein
MSQRQRPFPYEPDVCLEVVAMVNEALAAHEEPAQAAAQIAAKLDTYIGAWADDALEQPGREHLARMATVASLAASMIEFTRLVTYIEHGVPPEWEPQVEKIVGDTAEAATRTGDWLWAVAVAEYLVERIDGRKARSE